MALKKLIHHSKKAIKKVQSKVEELKSTREDHIAAEAKLPVSQTQRITVDISLWSATKIILVVFGFMFLQNIVKELSDILLTFFFALFIAVALGPMVDKLESKIKMPRSIAVIFIYIFVMGFVGFIISAVVPIMIDQLTQITLDLKDYLNDYLQNGHVKDSFISKYIPHIESLLGQIDRQELIASAQKYLQDIASNLADFASNALGVAASVVNGIFNFVLILLISFFMIMERGALRQFFTLLFPRKYEKYIIIKADNVQKKISEWVHGQLMLFLIIGTIAYIGLSIIGVEYALTLAMVAGLAEFLPYIGPMLAFVTAAPVAFNMSIIKGLWVIAFYIALQMFEGNVIVPIVMKKAVGLPPLVTIIAMLIGFQFLGIIGVILSVPLASIVAIFVGDFTGRKR
ncbi:MAG: AI-2E family transporter [Candidatus Gracilibacteria bacterium]|jgi:predicted PurR-regulated permease PerM|nr:AI-2E family transporter [Candidatus Gracilibacteria bacterium]